MGFARQNPLVFLTVWDLRMAATGVGCPLPVVETLHKGSRQGQGQTQRGSRFARVHLTRMATQGELQARLP